MKAGDRHTVQQQYQKLLSAQVTADEGNNGWHFIVGDPRAWKLLPYLCRSASISRITIAADGGRVIAA